MCDFQSVINWRALSRDGNPILIEFMAMKCEAVSDKIRDKKYLLQRHTKKPFSSLRHEICQSNYKSSCQLHAYLMKV